MATFVGGMGSPVANSATAASDHGLGAPAAASAPASSAANVAPISHEGAVSATVAPLVGGMGSPAAASAGAESFGGSVAPSHSEAPAVTAWFAPAHVEPSGVQWFATSGSYEGLGSLTTQSAAPGIATTTLGSVFASDSAHGWDGGMGGSFDVSELPFTHETSFDDTPIYTASADTPWIFASDFSGDGWFFV